MDEDLKYSFTCECGKTSDIPATQAGAELVCDCGRTNVLPSLSQLRRAAGQAAVEKSIVDTIKDLVSSKQLPGSQRCLGCGVTAPVRNLVAECERGSSSTRTEGGEQHGGIQLVLFGFPLGTSLAGHRTESFATDEHQGRETNVNVPASICDTCWNSHRRVTLLRFAKILYRLFFVVAVAIIFANPHWGGSLVWSAVFFAGGFSGWFIHKKLQFSSHDRVKTLLAVISEYEQLFEEFPHADILQMNADASSYASAIGEVS